MSEVEFYRVIAPVKKHLAGGLFKHEEHEVHDEEI